MGITRLSNRLRNQIIVRVADDLDLGEFADSQLATVNINPAVNIRRIRLAATDEVFAPHL